MLTYHPSCCQNQVSPKDGKGLRAWGSGQEVILKALRLVPCALRLLCKDTILPKNSEIYLKNQAALFLSID